ncbi:MAG TPA: hypothetical protein VE198_11965 [Actinoallomurus sp.]|jgi:hypothetical protein|nr:hypothetical protein [Actinoallomurus sp.]
MALKRDWRRVGAASATLSAGALVFFAAGTGPASAETRTAATGVNECKLGKLLCGLLGAGTGTPATPPKASASTPAKPKPKPSAKPRPQPKPKPATKPAPPGDGDDSVGVPPPLPVGGGASVPVPESSQEAPALPEIAPQDPLVIPGSAPTAQGPAQLVAESAPTGDTVPPALVATASGLIGAVAALNLSVLRRRRED